ncbi:MAG: 2-keto-4-pentenoate hydratase [Comamonadaceae bacterium]|nr:MAG: 2-keto-4-pentenoate hydratase [Comamonadaceae bacterium]
MNKKSSADLEEAARRLRDARISNLPTTPIRHLLGDNDIVAAYAVQRINTDLRISAGERLVGRKIGLTSAATQKQLGISECDYGVVFESDIKREDEEIQASQVIAPMVEGEIAFVMANDLKQESPTWADVARNVAYLQPAIEIVDSRIANWDIGIVDTIADNASGQFIVLGGTPTLLNKFDLELCGMRLDVNGRMASSGIGAACLGSPMNAVVWLARRMAQAGLPIRAGDIIMSGALGPFVKVSLGDAVSVRIAGLGQVQTNFARGATS